MNLIVLAVLNWTLTEQLEFHCWILSKEQSLLPSFLSRFEGWSYHFHFLEIFLTVRTLHLQVRSANYRLQD